MTHYKLLIFCLLSSVWGIAQNQPKIDSLLQVLETDITDRHKIDIYVKIAESYNSLDFIKMNSYGNKAYTLAKKIDYVEGEIEGINYMGVPAINQEKLAEAEQLFTKMLDLANKNNYHKGRVKAYKGLGLASWKIGEFDKALEYFLKSLEINQEFFDEGYDQGLLYNNIGLIYSRQGDYNKELKYYRISLDVFERINSKKGIAICYMNIGVYNRNIKNFEKAIDYFSCSIEIHKVLNQKIKIANGYTNLGKTYFQMGHYNKTLEYYFESLKIREDFNQKSKIANIYSKIGQVYVKLSDYKKALEYNLKSLKIYEDNSLDIKKPRVFYDIGQIYNIQNQTELARKYTNQGISSAQQQGLLKDIRDGAKQLVLTEKKDGNYKKIYEANVLLMQIKDSLYNQETVRKIATIEAKYEFKKEKDSLQLIQQQEITINIEKLKAQKKRTLTIYIFIGLFILIGSVCFIIIYKALQRKKIRLLRNRISRDLHDEIGSTLSSITLYGTVASASIIKEPKKASELLTLINTYSSSTIESMNDIVWAINSDKDSMRHLINRMRSFASELEDTGEWTIDINYETKILDKSLNMIQRRNIYLIFKEALNNSLKYSNGKEIHVKIDIQKNLMKLNIKDDGKGFELNTVIKENKSSGGNGLKNMRKRAEELGGKLDIYSILGRGTKVSLEFNMRH